MSLVSLRGSSLVHEVRAPGSASVVEVTRRRAQHPAWLLVEAAGIPWPSRIASRCAAGSPSSRVRPSSDSPAPRSAMSQVRMRVPRESLVGAAFRQWTRFSPPCSGCGLVVLDAKTFRSSPLLAASGSIVPTRAVTRGNLLPVHRLTHMNNSPRICASPSGMPSHAFIMVASPAGSGEQRISPVDQVFTALP